MINEDFFYNLEWFLEVLDAVRETMDEHTGWKTPTPLDSMRYAVTEVSEAIDAAMRDSRPDHARNNDRDDYVPDELADVVIMVCSAVNSAGTYAYRDYEPEYRLESGARGPQRDIDILSNIVSDALRREGSLVNSGDVILRAQLDALALCEHIAEFHYGEDVWELALDKLWRTMNKFSPEHLEEHEWKAMLAMDPVIREVWFTA